MTGLLLDTHTLFWLVSGEEPLADEALVAIGESQAGGALFLSPISAWELAVATKKHRVVGRPHLGDALADRWFREATAAIEAKVVAIHQRIALEAAKVITDTGHKDPGDCFLIATARVRKLALVTRDAIIRDIVAAQPGYLEVVVC